MSSLLSGFIVDKHPLHLYVKYSDIRQLYLQSRTSYNAEQKFIPKYQLPYNHMILSIWNYSFYHTDFYPNKSDLSRKIF